jgi:hypothetical protein
MDENNTQDTQDTCDSGFNYDNVSSHCYFFLCLYSFFKFYIIPFKFQIFFFFKILSKQA